MAGISAVQFNGSNAYELKSGEWIVSWPAGCKSFTEMAAGVQVYSSTAGASLSLQLKFLDDASNIISQVNKSYALANTNLWERATAVWTVPTGAVLAELRIIAVGGTVLIAQPKLVNGNEVGTYATNYTPQLTMLTPTGIYTGTITAKQIILSETENLTDRLTAIGAAQATFAIRDKLKEPNYTTINGGNLKTGTISSYTGSTVIGLSDDMFSFANGDFTYSKEAGAQIAGWIISKAGLSKSATVMGWPGTEADQFTIIQHLLRRDVIPDSDLYKYDINGDGRVSGTDVTFIRDYILGKRDPNLYGDQLSVDIKLDPNDHVSVVRIKAKNLVKNKEYLTQIGAYRSVFPSVISSYTQADYGVIRRLEIDAIAVRDPDKPTTNRTEAVSKATFTTADGKTVTVLNGIVASVV